jgi:hypothetical protein
MSDEVTLAQLAAEMAQLRRQMETVNQRLDMIYGAVTRLAEAQNSLTSTPVQRGQTQTAPAPGPGMSLTPQMMMDPGAMLDSLRQYAVNMGLDVSPETVDRLKSHPEPQALYGQGGQASPPADETKDEQK